MNFSIGGFVPRGEDGRSRDDVLFNNRDFLTFDIDDFNGATVGAEWLVGLGNYFEAGLGLGFYPRIGAGHLHRLRRTATAPKSSRTSSCASCRSRRRSGSCRSATTTAIEPYIGGGVGVFGWRYSETGEFVATDGSIFREQLRHAAGARPAR